MKIQAPFEPGTPFLWRVSRPFWVGPGSWRSSSQTQELAYWQAQDDATIEYLSADTEVPPVNCVSLSVNEMHAVVAPFYDGLLTKVGFELSEPLYRAIEAAVIAKNLAHQQKSMALPAGAAHDPENEPWVSLVSQAAPRHMEDSLNNALGLPKGKS